MIQLRLIDRDTELVPLWEATLAPWWRGHGWDPVPHTILPRLGVLAELAHPETERPAVPLAAAWLYMDNSIGVAMLEWIVTDPARPRDTVKALPLLIDFLTREAKRLGYGIVLATCRQPSLSKLLQRHGFHLTDRDVIHHLAIL